MNTKWGFRLGLFILTLSLLAACKPLGGTEWTLVSLNGHEPIPKTTITISFTGEGIVGYGGCNHYGAAVEIKDDTLIFEEKSIASTEFYCVEPDGNVEQEKEFLLTLPTVVTYSRSSERLEMKNEDGEVILIFQKGLPED